MSNSDACTPAWSRSRWAHGGDQAIADLLGLDAGTVARGRHHLLDRDVTVERVRRAGAGRRPVEKTPAVIARIDELMTHETAGDPMSGLKWTRRTTEKIAAELQSLGISVGPRTVARLLTQLGFSLRVNQKKRSTGSPARRNEQFEQIASLRERFVTDAAPIEIMFQYEKILNAIRKDLGHKNQGFKRGTLLGMWVNDIDSHV